jgi:hypothetical protein
LRGLPLSALLPLQRTYGAKLASTMSSYVKPLRHDT